MSYQLKFTNDGEETMSDLETEERQRVIQKFREIVSCPFRHPTDWDFVEMDGCAEGRFRVGDALRAFADVDDHNEIIRIHQIRRRENLYT
jgi:mRNA-degrading endonuclease RelE of RelBE toxin-antitoxin system